MRRNGHHRSLSSELRVPHLDRPPAHSDLHAGATLAVAVARKIPPTGSYAVDTRTDRVGRVMGSEGPYVQLRPPAGGTEWDVPPEALRPAGTLEELRAKVTEINKDRWVI